MANPIKEIHLISKIILVNQKIKNIIIPVIIDLLSFIKIPLFLSLVKGKSAEKINKI